MFYPLVTILFIFSKCKNKSYPKKKRARLLIENQNFAVAILPGIH